MSLSVQCIKQSAQNKAEECYNMLVDESGFAIKEKLFANNPGIDFYPNFLKLQIESNSGVTIKDNNSLLLYYSQSLPKHPKVFVTNVFDIIENKYDITKLYKESRTDDDYFQDTLTELRNEGFIDLREEDLEFVVKVIMLKYDTETYQDVLQEEVTQYLQQQLQKQSKLSEHYSEEKQSLEAFYDLSYNTTDFSQYYDELEENVPEFMFSNVTILFKSKYYESGVKGRFIKLDQIYNQIELNSRIPFVAISLQGDHGNPMVKVFNKLLDDVPQREIKSWILNEKKKRGLASYKKIKGLMLKYKVPKSEIALGYLTVNIYNNGLIYARVSTESEDDISSASLDSIVKVIRESVDSIVTIVNSIAGVFTKSRHLDRTADCDMYYESLSASLVTKANISKAHLIDILTNTYVSDNMFEIKDTLSEDILSMYYKKYGKRESEENDTDRRGLIVNVKDNQYKQDSSVITVYGAFSLNQMIAIVKQIILLTESFEQESKTKSKQKLKEKSHIKNLRKQGVEILSTKCQKPRQPKIGDTSLQPLPKSYALEYKTVRYVCPTKDYPYPGFTNENIVCCFKKDQRRRPTYIRNTKSSDLEIIVQPSNFKIKVKDSNGKTFDTFAIKIVSDYIDGFDETNSMSRYYFITDDNVLTTITNNELIETLEEEGSNIWLDSMPLAKILTEPPKNKCNFPPDMSKRTSTDINAVCKHHKKNKIFGYNSNSYPCCFDKERDVHVNKRRKEVDITKQHILMTDKILDFQRIGVLPVGLDTLFNGLINNKGGKLYRMGVLQNKSAFLNAILLAIGNKISINKRINNANEMKNLLTNYLKEHPDEFEKLNTGNISFKYESSSNYMRNILDNVTEIYWNDIVDLVQRITKHNILVLDIPYKTSESTKVPDYENIRLICNSSVSMKKDQPFIILIKRLKTFEVVISMSETKSDSSPKIKYTFMMNRNGDLKSGIVNFLLSYYEASCIKEDVYPENFPYKELMNTIDVVEVLRNTEHDIIAQVINKYNKVEYLMTKKGILIPVRDTGIAELGKVVTTKQLRKGGKLLNMKQYIEGIKHLNRELKKIDKKIEVIGVAVDNDQSTILTRALLTNYGKFVPVANEPFEPVNNIKLLDFKYYEDINDAILYNDSNGNRERTFNQIMKSFKTEIFEKKKQLGAKIVNNPDVKERIIQINRDVASTKTTKIAQLVNIFKDLLGGESSSVKSDFILHQIANDVLNDNVENLLLDNLVTSDVFNPKEVTQRDTESVLMSVDEIKKWVKKYEQQFS